MHVAAASTIRALISPELLLVFAAAVDDGPVTVTSGA
mgnify:CR=1 FL=1|jgi:hypothetical protein